MARNGYKHTIHPEFVDMTHIAISPTRTGYDLPDRELGQSSISDVVIYCAEEAFRDGFTAGHTVSTQGTGITPLLVDRAWDNWEPRSSYKDTLADIIDEVASGALAHATAAVQKDEASILAEVVFGKLDQQMHWLTQEMFRRGCTFDIAKANEVLTEMKAAHPALPDTPTETIVAAAVRVPMTQMADDRSIPAYATFSAPPPARHHSILNGLPSIEFIGQDNQGFLTSAGRFVHREEALSIALLSGQPMIDHGSRHPTKLFSEDLW